jgi:predicted nucleotidyltransferase
MTTAALDIPLVVARLAEFEPAVVYLFGSAVTGRLVASSDVDIAFLPCRPCDPMAVFDAAQRLAGDLGMDVDLIDLSRASAVFRAQVLGTGTAVHVADRLKRDEFEMYVLSDTRGRTRSVARCSKPTWVVAMPDDVSLNKLAIIAAVADRHPAESDRGTSGRLENARQSVA